MNVLEILAFFIMDLKLFLFSSIVIKLIFILMTRYLHLLYKIFNKR